jgi:general secretion pathway protein D
MITRRIPPLLAAALLLLSGCARDAVPVLAKLDEPVPLGGAAPRVDGAVGAPEAPRAPVTSYGAPAVPTRDAGPDQMGADLAGANLAGGDVSLDFADTDIREVAAQILGTLLRLTYTIDPSVHGTATLRTAAPIPRRRLIAVLQALLAQNGATLIESGVRSGAIWRVVPAAAAITGATLAGGDAAAGSAVVVLRYAAADDLARVLQPFVGAAGRVLPDAGRNALIVSGEPGVRATLTSLIQAFDIDVLAGQSYALLPVDDGDAKDFSAALQTALRGQSGGAAAGLVRVVPMDRMNAVLVIASQPRYLDAARRVFAVLARDRRDTVRTWHVYYPRNGNAGDLAYVLQQAFTPDDITAAPGQGTTREAGAASRLGQGGLGAAPGLGANGAGAGGAGAGGAGAGGLGAGSLGAGGIGASGGINASGGLNASGGAGAGGIGQAAGGAAAAPGTGGGAAANPLLGGLEASAGGGADAGALRIIANPKNNALLIHATGREEDTVEAMLRRLDIVPPQVRIDATIAEVTLNDALQYGTQFFFKGGGINGALNNLTQAAGTFGGLTSLALGTSFPGFVIGGGGAGGAPFALSLLQSVTTVNVLSSPQIMVLDSQSARLQVGALVPYLTTSSQSTLTSNAPVINSIGYQPTGVIMQVTPRINGGGQVTLDIDQEVSDVSTTQTTAGINSPTFDERNVSSRVVVQDGQTVGLAGLISDSATKGNSGIPWLKDIPLLGALAGTQNNQRTRTELLVLITPHVVRDARDARALTEDLRERLINAATVPDRLRALPPSGSTDPNAGPRRALGLDPAAAR